ncbi:MAG: hypothetical protein OXC18_16460 [Desulfurellaceae bacterium]|nr:hypothetical protein [Desulfurellaceae bacterium]
MSKAERLKEEIGWLKVVFGILVAIDVSRIAWLAQNVSRPASLLVSVCIFAVACVTLGIIWVNRTAYRKIDELEEL